VLTTLGSPIDAGIVGAAIVLPGVFGAFAGGVVIDRIGPRRTSVLADVLSAGAVAAMPLAAMTVGLGLPLVAVLAFAGALLDAPGATARQVILPDLAAPAGVSLERANGIFQAIENASFVIGPAIAGIAILAVGPLGALWIDAASFVVCAVLIRLLVPDVRPETEEGRADVAAGLRALRRDGVLRLLTIAAAAGNFVLTPLFVVVLPSLATSEGDSPAVLGAMLAAVGGGMVVSSLGFGVISRRLGRRLILAGGIVGTGLAVGLLSVVHGTPLVLGVLFAAGMMIGPINPLAFTVMAERVPAATRGRVFGAVLGGVLVASPLGMLALGAVSDAEGPRVAMLASAVAFVAIGVVVGLRQESRELDLQPTLDPPAN